MHFVSIYVPNYSTQKDFSGGLVARSWRVLLLVLALHYLTFILLSTQNSLLRPEKLEEMVINLSLPTIVPKGITEGFKEGREEIKHILPKVYQAVYLEECVLFLFASLIHNKILWGNIFLASLFTAGCRKRVAPGVF
jgi:hypothetical protein